MTPADIIALLATKSSNHHIINRYVKFVLACHTANNNTECYTEDHHICPRAKDLFPEYSDFGEHPWNCATLTARQHIIAHVMLWKIFGGSQMIALDYMLNVQNMSTGYNKRIVPPSIVVRYASRLRHENSAARRGKGIYKDQDGNRYLLSNSDPLIDELGLVGNNLGMTHSETTKQKMVAAKLPSRTIKLHFLDNSISVKLLSEDFELYLAQGWTVDYTEEDRAWVADVRYSKLSETMSGKSRYMNQNGEFVGMYTADDPIISEKNLIPHVTENMVECAKNNQKLAAAALVGTNIYNNGKVEARFTEQPDDPQWVLGRLPRTESHDANQKAAARAATLDHRFYNNGIETIKVHINDTPPPGYVPGMVKKQVSFTDGIDEYVANPDPTLTELSNLEVVNRIRLITHPNGKLIHKRMGAEYLRKHTLNLVFEVYSRTNSMPEHWGLMERLYLLERNITTPPKCEVCGGFAKPNPAKSTPSITCSAHCANRHPSKSEITRRSWVSRRQVKSELSSAV